MSTQDYDGMNGVRPGSGWSKERALLWKVANEEGTKKSDIAQAIGMSRSAVSRYINNDYPDSEEMVKAVREYLKKIGRWEDDPAEAEAAAAAETAAPEGGYISSGLRNWALSSPGTRNGCKGSAGCAT